MARPVVLLTIGGVEGIQLVNEELEALEKLLDPFHEKEDLTLKVKRFAAVTDISQTLDTYAGRIELFHYAGHANGGGLELGEQVALASGICNYFVDKKPPRVVFLNGCSTLGQVDDWLRAGVQAVIATETPIGDPAARQFSEVFYHHLSERETVAAAYQRALKRLALLEKDYAAPPSVRAIFSSAAEPASEETPESPWGLYLHPETGPDGANYRLPWYQGQILAKVEQINFEHEEPTNNYYLLDVLPALADHDVSIPGLVEKADRYEGELFDILLNCFPWTIGYHLSQLCTAREPLARAELLTNTYLALGQTLHYVALSEWWWMIEHQHTGQASPPPPQAFSEDDGADYPVIDHWVRFLTWQDYLNALPVGRALPRVVPELRGLAVKLREDKELIDADKFFSKLNDKAKLTEMAGIADELDNAEYYISQFLRACSFLANYKMLAVRGIKVKAARATPRSFGHVLGKLYANRNSKLTLRSEVEELADPYFSQSVIFTRREPAYDGKTDFICLSPLIIDLHTYHAATDAAKRQQLRIYTYSYTDAVGVHYFHTIERSLFLARIVPGDFLDSTMPADVFSADAEVKIRKKRARPNQGVTRLLLKNVERQIDHLRKDLGL